MRVKKIKIVSRLLQTLSREENLTDSGFEGSIKDLISTNGEFSNHNPTDYAQQLKYLIGYQDNVVDYNSEILSIIEHDGYNEELIKINRGNNNYITGTLLVPQNLPFPKKTVLAIHGHGYFESGRNIVTRNIPKKEDSGYGIKLARMGFNVFCIDLYGYGDRRNTEEINSIFPRKIDNYERFLFTSLLLTGRTLLSEYLDDLQLAIRYLLACDNIVDKSKIAVIGHSMGGTLASLLMVFDSNISAGVSVSGLSTWREIINNVVYHNYGIYIPGILSVGDFDTILPSIYPRPFMIISGENDKNFPVKGVKAIIDNMVKQYSRKNKSCCFNSLIHSGGHRFTRELQFKAFSFLEKWI